MESVILCGGLGTRMKPILSGITPKHMLKIHSETIIQRLLRQLSECGLAYHKIVVPIHDNTLKRHIEDFDGLYGQCTYVPTISNKCGDLLNGLALSKKNSKLVFVMGDCVFLDEDIHSFIKSGLDNDETDMLAGVIRPKEFSSGVFVVGDIELFTRIPKPGCFHSAGIYCLTLSAVELMTKLWDGSDGFISNLVNSCISEGLSIKSRIMSTAYDNNTPESYWNCLQEIDSFEKR
jgi:dTDP-glucose pyrophosphorylase